jgi:hypothetical protein
LHTSAHFIGIRSCLALSSSKLSAETAAGKISHTSYPLKKQNAQRSVIIKMEEHAK